MRGWDSETTGVDLRHGAKPFLITIGYENGDNEWWEWLVDPLTRQPDIPPEDLEEVQEEINKDVQEGSLVFQNPDFDVTAFSTIGLTVEWSAILDTLMAGHLLASNQPHSVSWMAGHYLGINLAKYEEAVKLATNEARRLARSKFPEWRLAKKGLPDMPSVKTEAKKRSDKGVHSESPWKNDMWLPKRLAVELNYPDDHEWYRVAAEYANSDSAILPSLIKRMIEEIEAKGLWEIYVERLKLLPIINKMESFGVTVNADRRNEIHSQYVRETEAMGNVCKKVAVSFGCELELPKSGNNKSLLNAVFGWSKFRCDKCSFETDKQIDVTKNCPKCGEFGCLVLETNEGMGFPVVKRSKKTGKPSLDKKVLEKYEAELDHRSKQAAFVRNLRGKRQRDTALSYLEGYERFWLPALDEREYRQWKRLYPFLNPTGTHTLRFSSSNPNEQNISKQEGFNLRYCFGPMPGREWWSADARNIELRIPAYEANETEMIELFENPTAAPYFGSYHMLIFDTLHPEMFAKYGVECKKKYESTWYQWTKNGNFAVQYGAVEASGTADAAYHVKGAQKRIQARFRNIEALNRKFISIAEKGGYVETMPDKTVNPERGYPLLCTRTDWGSVLPTVPLNYHVQGTAMWWMMKAMIRVQEYLDQVNEDLGLSFENGYHIIMQVHDELVFDFPAPPPSWKKDPWLYNLPKMRKIRNLMEMGGDDIGLPTPVSTEYHPETWSEGISL